METTEQRKDSSITLPKGEFADDDDSCGDCDWGTEYKDGGFFGTDKVYCSYYGKWVKASHCCPNHK